MELTKQESRLLKRKETAAIFWIGVVAIVLAVAAVAFMPMRFRQSDAIYGGMISSAEAISVDTAKERSLKDALVTTTRQLNTLYGEYKDQATQKISWFLFMGGCALLGASVLRRRYVRLVERVQRAGSSGTANAVEQGVGPDDQSPSAPARRSTP